MEKVATLIILLVCYGACAQAGISTLDHRKHFPTSNVPASEKQEENHLININGLVEQNISVQDWQQTCAELCGSGDGGPMCGPHCNSFPKGKRTVRSYDTAHEEICTILCKNRLGGNQCTCDNYIPKTEVNLNEICSNGCANNVVLPGCPACNTVTNNNNNNPATTLRNGAVIDPSALTGAEENATQSSSNFSSTPDWEEVCKTLCKSGDGGALCNCDLPPFF